MAKRISLFREWEKIAGRVALIVKQLIPEAEVYVFGSVVTGKVTGSSDIDVLVVVPGNLSEREIHTYLSMKLEEHLGPLSYIIDLYVTYGENLDKPPYKWWIKNSVRIS